MKRLLCFTVMSICLFSACTNKETSKYLSYEALPEFLKSDSLALTNYVEIMDTFALGKPKIVHFVDKTDTTQKVEKHYYESGKILWSGVLKNNRRDGKWTAWYEHSGIWSIGYYKDGVPIGLSEAFYETGLLRFSKIYNDDGKLDGVAKYFSPTGDILAEIEYKDDSIISQTKIPQQK
jgi:hypothetical protein